MSTQTHMITGTNGYALADGLSAADARRVAQITADARGETVTVTPYTIDDEDGTIVSDLDGEYEVEPSLS